MTLASELRLSSHGRARLTTLLPIAAALITGLSAGLIESLAPRGHFGEIWLFLALLLCAAGAAFHQALPPSGGDKPVLGLGTVTLPLAILVLGAVPAGWLALGAVFASSAGRSLLGATASPPVGPSGAWEALRRGLRPWTEAGSSHALATFFAAALWIWLASRQATAATGSIALPSLAVALSSGGLYLLLAWLLPLASDRLRRPDLRPALGKRLRPLALDTAGWLGGYLVVLAAGERPSLALALLAGFAALALEAARHARRAASAHRHIGDLEAVGQAGKRMIESPHQLASLINRIRAECRRVLPTPWFQFELMPGGPMSGQRSISTAEGRSWFSGPDGVLLEGVPKPGSAPPTLPGFHKRASWRVLDYPLEAEGRVLACLRLWCDPRTLDDEDRELLERLLPQMAASVHRCMLDRDAKSDPLTGVAVRRVLEERLESAYQRAIEDGRPFSVVMLDLDHFKRINDTHGHDAGDQALKAFADVLAANTRDPDLCCRYGGEEFTWLLEDTGGDTALAAAERLRAEVERMDLVLDGKPVPVTMCAGVASFPELHVKTASELLLLADEALYEAKEQGRNRAILARGLGRFLNANGEETLEEQALPPVEPPRIFV